MDVELSELFGIVTSSAVTFDNAAFVRSLDSKIETNANEIDRLVKQNEVIRELVEMTLKEYSVGKENANVNDTVVFDKDYKNEINNDASLIHQYIDNIITRNSLKKENNYYQYLKSHFSDRNVPAASAQNISDRIDGILAKVNALDAAAMRWIGQFDRAISEETIIQKDSCRVSQKYNGTMSYLLLGAVWLGIMGLGMLWVFFRLRKLIPQIMEKALKKSKT